MPFAPGAGGLADDDVAGRVGFGYKAQLLAELLDEVDDSLFALRGPRNRVEVDEMAPQGSGLESSYAVSSDAPT